MQQATEITRVALRPHPQRVRSGWGLLRCSILSAVIMGAVGCTGKGRNSDDVDSGRVHDDKLNATRVLKRGLPGEPRTLDPQLADDTFSFPVLRDLYEGLTAEDRNGQVVPGAAESWTVDETGTVYLFKLRPNAKWSNGDPTVASEFVQGLRRAVDPQTASGSSALLAVMKGASDIIAGRKKVTDLGVTAIDKSTVRIELEHPAPFVLQILSQPIAAPSYEGAPLAVKGESSNKNLGPYDGPYVLAGRIPGSFIDLTRNGNYW